jgi:RNA polymerase-binding transcription factor DksA
MRYFTIEQRETLDRRLKERAAELRSEIDEALERADTSEAGELKQVGAAIKRLHTPDFGVCQDCGADIPYARLEAQPTAIRCRACEALTERTHAEHLHAAL